MATALAALHADRTREAYDLHIEIERLRQQIEAVRAWLNSPQTPAERLEGIGRALGGA